jgi:tetratricopeptide (TPR) repeat protein
VKRIVLCCVLVALSVRVARADDAAAKALFDQGKTLFAEGRYGEACAKLEGSFKLAALSSTRGLLGACYEKIGKLASAWAAYRDSAAIADRTGNGERAAAAREKAAELEPRLARLTIDATAVHDIPGITVMIDGIAQPQAALGSELPIDAGPHVIEATAVDYTSWKTTTDLEDGDRRKVVVESLVADPTRRLLLERHVADEQRAGHRRTLIAVGLIGSGGVAVGAAVTLGLLARSQWHRAQDAGCTDAGACPTDAGARDVDSAALKADLATYVGGAGLLLVGAGVLVQVMSPRPKTKAELELVPSITPSAATLVLEGRF